MTRQRPNTTWRATRDLSPTNRKESKMKANTWKWKASFIVGVAACLLTGGLGFAGTVSGTSNGAFVNPRPDGAVVTGVGTAYFTWGTPADAGGLPSSLLFAGKAISVETPDELNSVFSAGTLSYHNGTIVDGSEANSVDLLLTFELTSPSGVTKNFQQTMTLVNTSNVEDPIASADYVYLPASFPQITFEMDSVNYVLTIVGFGGVTASGFSTLDRFFVLEDDDASADLLIVLTAGCPATGRFGVTKPAPACGQCPAACSTGGGPLWQIEDANSDLLELRCMDYGAYYFQVFFKPSSGGSRVVGECLFGAGQNDVAVFHDSADGSLAPNCLLGSRWLNVDAGDDDDGDGMVDWFVFRFDKASGVTRAVNFESPGGPSVPGGHNVAKNPDGSERIWSWTTTLPADLDPSLPSPGPVVTNAEGPSTIVDFLRGDLDGDGDSDADDVAIFNAALHTGIGMPAYNSLADFDGSGFVDELDEFFHFGINLYVDDDAPGDPAPGDPSASDPLENGTPLHPFDAIQEAIDAAAPGRVVMVLDGTYTGAGNRDISFLGKAITVRSQNGPVTCTVDCQGDRADEHRGFVFENGEGAGSILMGFTIINGVKREGAAIACFGASPVVTGNGMMGNWAFEGGAILCVNSSAVLAGNVLDANIGYYGAGVACTGGSPVIKDNNITNNRLARWDIIGGGQGGGIRCVDCADTLIAGNIIGGNGGSITAGGIGVLGGSCEIIGNLIYGNNGVFYGAGVLCDGAALRLSHNIITGNFAFRFGGGAIYCSSSILNADNCTIADSTANDTVKILAGSNANLLNCILWGNSAPVISCEDSALAVSYCDVQGGQPAVSVLSGGSLAWGPGNIDADPLFAAPGSWDWSAFVWTQGDYHLKSKVGRWDPAAMVDGAWVVDAVHSPCIDAGDPASPFLAEPDPNGGRINMGAYGDTDEASKSVMLLVKSFPLPGVDITGTRPGTTDYAVGVHDAEVIKLTAPDKPTIGGSEHYFVRWVVDGKQKTLGVALCKITVAAPATATAIYRAASPIYVDDDAPNDPAPQNPKVSDPLENGSLARPFDCIQEAIDVAFAGDTVIVLDGFYTGTGNRDIDFRGKAITVRSKDGVVNCIVEIQGSPSDQHRGFWFHSGETAASVLEGFTIRGGHMLGFTGGGILCERGSSPTIRGNVVAGNLAGTGGGIACYAASPQVLQNQIVANSAIDSAGGMACDFASNPLVAGNLFLGNSARCCGGLGTWRSSPAVTENVFSLNSAQHGAGAMEIADGSAPQVTKNQVTDNRALESGAGGINVSGANPMLLQNDILGNMGYAGGLRCCGSHPDVLFNTISGNTACNSGGGVLCVDATPLLKMNRIIGNTSLYCGGGVDLVRSSPTFINNVIANNIAAMTGGGVCCHQSIASLTNLTVAFNAAGTKGGGFYAANGSRLSVRNTILWQNAAPNGPSGCLAAATAASTTVVGYSDVSGGQPAISVSPGCTLAWDLGNFDWDPMFANPANGDYHLQSRYGRFDPSIGWVFDVYMSICIDRGDPVSPYFNEPEPNGDVVNVGAYGNTAEASKSAGPKLAEARISGDANGDGSVNVLDLVFVRNCMGMPANTGDAWRADVNEDGKVDVKDLITVRNRMLGR